MTSSKHFLDSMFFRGGVSQDKSCTVLDKISKSSSMSSVEQLSGIKALKLLFINQDRASYLLSQKWHYTVSRMQNDWSISSGTTLLICLKNQTFSSKEFTYFPLVYHCRDNFSFTPWFQKLRTLASSTDVFWDFQNRKKTPLTPGCNCSKKCSHILFLQPLTGIQCFH